MPSTRIDLLMQELSEVKEREKMMEVNHQETIDTLNYRIQLQ